jgi:hypothetical protein
LGVRVGTFRGRLEPGGWYVETVPLGELPAALRDHLLSLPGPELPPG